MRAGRAPHIVRAETRIDSDLQQLVEAQDRTRCRCQNRLSARDDEGIVFEARGAAGFSCGSCDGGNFVQACVGLRGDGECKEAQCKAGREHTGEHFIKSHRRGMITP